MIAIECIDRHSGLINMIIGMFNTNYFCNAVYGYKVPVYTHLLSAKQFDVWDSECKPTALTIVLSPSARVSYCYHCIMPARTFP